MRAMLKFHSNLVCVLMWVLSFELKKALKFGISLDDTKFKHTHTETLYIYAYVYTYMISDII